MRECNYICDHVTDRSMIIMDEVGRGTSNIDGIALAIAIAEYLLTFSPTTYTLFVTHFTQVSSLAELYCNARNMHFKTVIHSGHSGQSGTNIPYSNHNHIPSIKYSHQICEGVCSINNGYGLVLAELCGFPAAVLLKSYFLHCYSAHQLIRAKR